MQVLKLKNLAHLMGQVTKLNIINSMLLSYYEMFEYFPIIYYQVISLFQIPTTVQLEDHLKVV